MEQEITIFVFGTTFYIFLVQGFEQEEILKKFNVHLYCFMWLGL